MHPTLPFALRLSSTLMVGVVRVYREQTRIILSKYEIKRTLKLKLFLMYLPSINDE